MVKLRKAAGDLFLEHDHNPGDAGAIINLGKAGRIELAHNTTFAVSFDDSSINGSLSTGSITVLNAAHAVGVKTLSGDVHLNAGETAAASSATASKAARLDQQYGLGLVGF